MKLVARSDQMFYTDYEIKLTPEGTSEDTKFLVYAPFYITNDFIPMDMLSEIRAYVDRLDTSAYKASVIGQSSETAMYNNVRNSDVFFIKDESFNRFNDYISNKVQEINKNVYNLDLSCYMHPQYTIYNGDQYFNWHPDGPFGIMDRRGLNCIPENLQWRKLSVTIALNDESEYEGGDFQIVNAHGNVECNGVNTIRLAAGSAVLFPAFASHRVTPVTRGVRKTLVYWFCGPRWR